MKRISTRGPSGAAALQSPTTTFLTSAVIFLLLAGGAYAQTDPPRAGEVANTAPAAAPLEERKLALEERKAALDRERLDFEKEKFKSDSKREGDKLDNEKTKTYLSAASAIVPLVAALFTLGYSVWSFREQTVETARLQNDSAKLQFEIKAAEIAFSGKSPKAVRNRATVLKKMFGGRLPANFPPPFEPGEHGGGKETPEDKMVFLELLLKYPDKKEETYALWEAMFGDPWLGRVKPLLGGVGSDGGPEKGKDKEDRTGNPGAGGPGAKSEAGPAPDASDREGSA